MCFSIYPELLWKCQSACCIAFHCFINLKKVTLIYILRNPNLGNDQAIVIIDFLCRKNQPWVLWATRIRKLIAITINYPKTYCLRTVKPNLPDNITCFMIVCHFLILLSARSRQVLLQYSFSEKLCTGAMYPDDKPQHSSRFLIRVHASVHNKTLECLKHLSILWLSPKKRLRTIAASLRGRSFWFTFVTH